MESWDGEFATDFLAFDLLSESCSSDCIPVMKALSALREAMAFAANHVSTYAHIYHTHRRPS
eukprot:1601552-Pyramimonas_sp.AAC.1